MTSQLQSGPELGEILPHDIPPRSPAAQRVPALVVLVLLLGIGAMATLSMRPPAPRPAGEALTAFSADRAIARLSSIAAVPHPTGSPAAAHVRTYLVDSLRAMGLQPEVQTRVSARTPAGGRPTVATVANVHARIPGSQPSGRVMLVAHYDSVPIGAGASDDGANVAAILEIVRAVRAGPQPRNDVEVLFTEGEEDGLLGAQAYVDAGLAGDPSRVVALNLEARGTSGPAVMFQMAGGGLVPAVRAADPLTTSFADAVYAYLPNDTDLTALSEAGIRGLNFAFFDGSLNYHTTHDDIAHVSGDSVQDMGDSVLATVRYLAGSDLAAGGSDATYFSLFGTVVSYPGWLVLPLAVLAVGGYLALLWLGRRHGLRLRGVGRAAATFAVVIPATAVIGLGGWWLLTLVRPELRFGSGTDYHPGPYALAEAALTVVALVAWYRWARRKASATEVAVGALGWSAMLATALAVLLPGGAYLFTWPVLLSVAATGAALRYSRPGSAARTLAGCTAALAGMALVVPIAVLLLPTLGLSLSVAPLLLGALVAAVMAAVVEPLPRRRVLSAGMVLVLVAGLAAAVVVTATGSYDARDPRPVSLVYAYEADTGASTWVSGGGRGQPQVGALLTGPVVHFDDRIPSLGGWPLSTGPAPAAGGLVAPQAQALSATESAGVRTVHLRVRVPAGAYMVEVYADTSAHQVLDATVDGIALAGGQNVARGAGDWRWSVRYAAPPADGVDVTLRVRGSGPVPIRMVSITVGLPSGVGAPTLRPGLSWPGWSLLGGETYAVRTARV